MSPLWTIRIFFLCMCTFAGYEVSQVRPEWIDKGWLGLVIGFGLGGLCVALDEMLKGFSLRAFTLPEVSLHRYWSPRAVFI